MQAARQENQPRVRRAIQLSGKAHALEDGLETRIAAQCVDAGIDRQPHQTRIALLERPLELVAGTSLVAKREHHVGAVPMSKPELFGGGLPFQGRQTGDRLVAPARSSLQLQEGHLHRHAVAPWQFDRVLDESERLFVVAFCFGDSTSHQIDPRRFGLLQERFLKDPFSVRELARIQQHDGI